MRGQIKSERSPQPKIQYSEVRGSFGHQPVAKSHSSY